jgi:5-methylcytosine-specific restriction endonuclease McrA
MRLKGFKHSEETKKKISKAHWKGGKPKCFDCKKQLSNYDIKRCRKCQNIYRRGKNNNWWIDGRTPKNHKIRNSIEYRLWRESTFARDGYTCQKCKDNTGGNLKAHHIKNFAYFPELRFAIDNGITFCRGCHKEFHHIYGNRNNNLEQIIEFLR